MPHIIIEHSSDLDSEFVPNELMLAVHETSMEMGIFEEKSIKIRTKNFDHSFVEGRPANFMHITVYLFKGRDVATKRKLTENIITKVKSMITVPIASLSVDARDTDQDIYVKILD
ncbi:5-carboxymethyl-2-hydroxymuconate Delta-isomerase [Kordiimonas sp. SCSIO 12610]|uniref:5-carboxymethyl-2-hydroxymuconate Delta-isomerase n=1 Tax=Kordiimonas sp. SCSIO 12610 TaxID=2829597 RepID=UPI00210DB1BE|nr:hypothetical protein [Kordiimonas sp. SCSIO 12610]UTW53914.1 hypothetical protein KFF44_08640 [Kordiimonas sp. SCSIO 12610]